jgi:hypothetical protein
MQMSRQKAVKPEAKQALAPKSRRVKRAAKVPVPARPAPPEQAEAMQAEEAQEDTARTETDDGMGSWPLTPEEDDQLDDVLAEMEQYLIEPEGVFPPDDQWQDYHEPPVEQYMDIPEGTPTGESRGHVPEAGRLQVVEQQGTLIAHCGARKITREELALIPVPEATRTHQPIAHHRIIEALTESLSFRHILVVREEYAVSPDGGRMFGVLDLSAEWNGVRFSVGLRNSNDKTMRLGMTAGYRVTVCDNMMFKGDFAPVLYKHTRKLDLLDVLSLGVDRIQRSFAPLTAQIQTWQEHVIADEQAKLLIYRAFLEDRFPRAVMAEVHHHYFEPGHEEFRPRTLWSLSNAFTSAFKALRPVRQFTATARLGRFLEVSLNAGA